MKKLAANYDHKQVEKRLQAAWQASGVYEWQDDLPREQTFVIDTPPPTVSGILHMGHIFSYTQADFIARYQRMSGKDVFYPMGFDDNGLPTERLVEKEKKIRGKDMKRADFVALCRDVVKSAEDEFRDLFKSTGLSVDWRQEYQTISDDVRKLSQESFLDLIKNGDAYRDFRPTYWDWVDGTAIAQAEIENKEMPGIMNEIEFTLEDGTQLIIATTRPELLGACVAVMYHPEDPNAAQYAGKYAITPLFGVKVPMLADELVERDKGTGLVMCCTFGDDTDKEWWRKHGLQLKAILSPEGKISSEIEALNGLKPKQAQAKIIELLKESGKLLKQTDIVHTVKCAERSGTPIEIIPTSQWFIRVSDKKQALLEKADQCNWYPDFMQIRINQWIEGLKEDWCISRQRFFGVPFPLWYSNREGEEGKILFAETSQLPVDPLVDLPNGYSKDEVTPSYDIMDTWATSSITPQINARAIGGNSDRFAKLFPADLRPQAHEIIRTWAFYTIVKAYLHSSENVGAEERSDDLAGEFEQSSNGGSVPPTNNSIPWKNLMISGWCLAADKSKMSKSKGNVVTPVGLIEEKSSDVVRYWASTSRLGSDTAFSEDLLKIGRKLVNKLWNATSFASLHLEKISEKPTTPANDIASGKISETLDKWIVSRLYKTIEKATLEFERFEYCDARVAIEDFFWKDFCDNYLELVKSRAYEEEVAGCKSQASISAHYTLYHCLDAILRLFAPFIPHISEELYNHIFDEQNSIHRRGNWTKLADYSYDADSEKSGVACVAILEAIRKAKSEKKVSIKFPIKQVNLSQGSKGGDFALIAGLLEDLKAAGNVENLDWSQTAVSQSETEDKLFAIEIIFAEEIAA